MKNKLWGKFEFVRFLVYTWCQIVANFPPPPQKKKKNHKLFISIFIENQN